ncbi:MAG: hypothetical protein ACTSRK_06895 [Promethearchaeota archaeon]
MSKKNWGILVFSLMICSFIVNTEILLEGNVSLMAPSSSYDDMYEDNDSYDQAYELEKGELDEQTGMYQASLHDEDWYIIDLLGGGNLSILVIFMDDNVVDLMNQFEVGFYSGDHETPVGEITFGEGILQICLESAPVKGSYYIYLNPLSSIILEYALYVWSLMEDDYEENDEISSAKEIYEDSDLYYNYLYALDDDWYKVYLEPGWSITFDLWYLSYANFLIEVIGTDEITPIVVEFLYQEEFFQIMVGFELSGDLIDTAGFYYIHIEPNQDNSIYGMDLNVIGNSLQTPLLNPIGPNPNEDGHIYLDWNSNDDVGSYSLYRESSEVLDVTLLTPIADYIQNSYYYDDLTENGTFYYAVTSNTGGESSSPSNCESVEVGIIPFSDRSPVLDEIQWNSDDYGEVRLRWGSLYGADYYLVYRDTIEIIDYSSLEYIALTPSYENQPSYYWYDNLEENGTYYYAIVAVKGEEHSLVSNSESVSVAILPFNQRSPRYFDVYPSYTEDGYVQLNWASVEDAQSYYIYRDTSEITDISGLNPIAIQMDTWYEETLYENGTFYYSILPYNGFEFGELAAFDSVVVNLIPFTEKVIQLYPIYWHEAYYEEVHLDWYGIGDANNYLIYRHTSEITEISELYFIGISDYPSFTDYVPANGTYYYVILATNGFETSTMSNCEAVTVNIIPFYDRVIQYFYAPEFTDTGEIYINWDSLPGATSYSLYRETFEITNISSLTPLQVFYSGENYWMDNIETNGTYWYALVANNGTFESALSDCQIVEVAINPFSERSIDYLYGYTDMNEYWIHLHWDEVHGADYYEIYRSDSLITDISGLTVYDISPYSNWEDIIPYNGTFYYVVRAFNGSAYTPISSCIMIEQIFLPFNELEIQLYDVRSYDDGSVYLDWSWLNQAMFYSVYRSTSEITDISSLTPINTVNDNMYVDYVNNSGLYYYIVVANNGSIDSEISACRSVYVNIIPFHERTPDLWCDFEISSGEVKLEWSSFNDAEMYYIYRLDFQLDGIDGLSPIAMTPNTYYEEILTTNDTFYYVVVGYNGIQLSGVSNCQRVSTNLLPFWQMRPEHLGVSYDDEWGEVYLSWQRVFGAKMYYIYKDSAPIISVEGLEPVGFQIDDGEDDWAWFSEYPEDEGRYFYSVVAYDGVQMSLPSYSRDVNVVKYEFGIRKINFDLYVSNEKGMVHLSIYDGKGAELFYIFRDTSPISDIIGLEPIAEIVADSYYSAYTDILPDNGEYYYVIVANNGTVNSSISEIREAFIDGIQDVISPEIWGYSESSGKVHIYWDYQDSAAEYLIYREMNNITDLGGLTPYASTQNPWFDDYSISTNDSYYYVVVAKNGLYTSGMSNCLNISVNMYDVEDPPIISQVYQSNYNQIYLEWNYVSFASIFYIYRDLTNITDISGLEPVGVIYDSSYYYDEISDEGNYFYVVVAGNGEGNSSISNCMNVTVEFVPPDTPTLLTIVPAIDDDGEIYLDWDYNPLADGYYIYRCDSEIYDPANLILVGNSGESSYTDWISSNQVYYYAIAAYNKFGLSEMSNVESVENISPPILNYAYVGTPYEWIDTSSNPILQQGEDPTYLEVDLEFDFEFYGISYSKIYISQNGYLSFSDSSPYESWGDEFPTSNNGMKYVISPFLVDFRYGGSLGTVSVLNGSGYCAISWENMEYNMNDMSFQVILFDDGSIKFQYDNIGYIDYYVTVGINLGDNIHGESYNELTTQTDDFAFMYIPYLENVNPMITLPSDLSYFSNDIQTYTISWTISDPDILNPIYRIIVDGEVAVDDSLWSSGGTVNFDVTGWEIGQHLIMIFVEDGYGAVVVDYVWIFVEEVPVIISSGDLSFEEGTQSQILTWTILDNTYNSPTYNISVDGVLIVENEPWPGSKKVNYDVSSFSVGNYVVEFVVDDGMGNTAVDAVVVSVYAPTEDPDDPPIISTPEDITYYEGSPDSYIIYWTITDDTVSNPTFSIEVNYEIIVENATWISGLTVPFNVSGWAEGTYTVQITVNDGIDGEVVDVVVVTVTGTPDDEQTFWERIPGFNSFHLVGLSILTLIFIKKQRKSKPQL